MKEHVARRGWWRGLDPRSSATLFLIAACGTYGAVIASVLPSLVGTWIADVGLTERMAGEVATINVLAATLGLCLALFLVSRWSLPRIARLGLLLAISGDLLSILASDMLQLSFLRAVQGVGVGLLVGATTNWIGRHEYAARGFGMYIMLQFILAAVLIAAIPALMPYLGAASVYVTLLALAAVSLILYPLLGLNGGAVPLRPAAAEEPEESGAAADTDYPALLKFLSVLAFGLFNIAAIGLWSYMLRYGEVVGLSSAAAAQTLAISSLCGIPGTILVIALSARYGRFLPLMLALAIYTVPAAVFAVSHVAAAIFVAGLVVQNIAWAVVAPYFQAVQAALDRSGRLAVWGMIVASIGAGLGPAFIGFAIDGTSYGMAFGGAVLALGLAALAGAVPALVTDRRERPTPAEGILAGS
ncbi:major facilitator superfamily MFS_1 [Parvibaculum lavamentivorans DS-1]|uniref:Major facilitator superfamily MFS_1 n=1 Tax=Parvibaculum lavamentivorans (strain DS-1 / DSM 13023 / NCIMB 13966) TaxID=402881 RepID=A7HPF4_PARL1|nr:MFS transporter [Parvibaculum lavamentivorans]ABS61787.1 major facilitator superfamily MFS_1 [Parvibaculum lavamentivorans DS-1]